MTASGKQFKLVTAARVIDGKHPPVENGAVLLQGTEVIQAGPAGEVRAPEGAEVEEHHFPDGTILPGLIDVHAHFNYTGDGTHTDDVMQLPDDVLLLRSVQGARIHLQSGVTTVRETGAKNRTAFSLREGNRLGLVETPRMLVCGRPVTMTGGHMWQMGSEVDGVEGVRKAVRQLVKEGADFIKVPATGGSTSTSYPYSPSFSSDELAAIVDEAHKFDKLVGTHCLSTAGVVNSLDAGVDMIIHGYMREPDGSYEFDPSVAERIAREGKTVNPTLYSGRALLAALQTRLQMESDNTDDGPAAHLVETVQYEIEMRLEQSRLLLEAGVRLIPGSDAGFGWYTFGQFWRELECFAEVGMSNLEALFSGTADAAEAVGLSNVTGTLEVGNDADLLVVQGDPSRDIKALDSVLAVFLRGAEVDIRAAKGLRRIEEFGAKVDQFLNYPRHRGR